MSKSLIAPTIRLAAAVFGTIAAGPLGGAIGGFVGTIIGPQAEKSLDDLIKRVGEKASETVFGNLSDSLVERLSGSVPDLASVYNDSLRSSLSTIRQDWTDGSAKFSDWFDNWDRALSQEKILDFEASNKKIAEIDFASQFSDALVRLDAQGKILASNGTNIILVVRVMEPQLFNQVESTLPSTFRDAFSSRITDPKCDAAWKQLDLEHKDIVVTTLNKLEIDIEHVIGQNEELIKKARDMQEQVGELRRQIEGLKDFQAGLLRAIKDMTEPHTDPLKQGLEQAQGFMVWAGEQVGSFFGSAGEAISHGAITISDATMNTIMNIQNGLAGLPDQDANPNSEPNLSAESARETS